MRDASIFRLMRRIVLLHLGQCCAEALPGPAGGRHSCSFERSLLRISPGHRTPSLDSRRWLLRKNAKNASAEMSERKGFCEEVPKGEF